MMEWTDISIKGSDWTAAVSEVWIDSYKQYTYNNETYNSYTQVCVA